MRKSREILRLKWHQRRSHREIARALAVGAGTVHEVARRAGVAGITTWAAVEHLSEDELEAQLYPASSASKARPIADAAQLHLELRRPGVTLRLLHEEYAQANPNAYGYTQFVAHYRAWADTQRVTMRQVHTAGEKVFVDYAGKKPSIVDAKTGERRQVELFVAVLGASNYTWAEATETQRIPDWIGSHVRLLEYLGGVPRLIVPDQLKSGVTTASRYDPTIQRTYEELAQHYSTAILPARPASPRDKAKVEGGVLIAERWILGRLRNVTCFSLDELNEQIAALLLDLNTRAMKRYGTSRRELFDKLDAPALAPLPMQRFTHGEWSHAKVALDYHVRADHHDYSVPYRLVGEAIEVRTSAAIVEMYLRGKRVASHARSHERGGTTTSLDHMPMAHRKHAEQSVEEILAWSTQIGPHTKTLVERVLTDRPHPEHGYRSCLGLRRLVKRYGPARVESACERALVFGARSYRHVESILQRQLDTQPLPTLTTSDAEAPAPLDHEQIRGPNYYH